MRILHLLSQIEVTGAEVYAVQLADDQIAAGNQVWIMSDTLHTVTIADYIPLSLHIRTVAQRWRNIKQVRKFIKQYKVDIVHAHSRAAIWVGYFATFKTKVPLVSTIHGRQKYSMSKRLWDMYGDRVIAICENVKKQIINEVHVKPNKIAIIPNGINFSLPQHRMQPQGNTLIVAGRTTGPKGEILARLLIDVFPLLLAEDSRLNIQLIGGKKESLSIAAQQQLEALQIKYPQRLSCLGFVKHLSEYLMTAKCIIAAGRIAIEALALGVPVIAVGEASLVGLIDEQNIAQGMASNFGDIATAYQASPIQFNYLPSAINRVFAGFTLPHTIVDKVRKTYALSHVAVEVMQTYRTAVIEKRHPKHIPILMYHKVLPQAEFSQHKTYVTSKRFAKHMRFLAKHHFTPLTFKDYFAFRDGQLSLIDFPKKPIIITFDDGYLNNFQYALPIMQRYNFTAVIFALGDLNLQHNQWDAMMGEPRHVLMDCQQLKELSIAGFEIGAHSLTHPDLTKLSPSKAYTEILQSKKNLEVALQQTIISFAYPYGRYNVEVKDLVKKAGFYCAVATDTGGLRLEDDKFAIFRVNVMPGDHWGQFFKKTSSWYRGRYWRKRGK